MPGSVDGCNRRVALLVVLGLDEAATAAVVEQAAGQNGETGPIPVFLTDLDRFDLFSTKGHVFEHIASARSRSMAPPHLPWDHYVQRRLDLLQAKWRPVATIPFGMVANRTLADWRKARDVTIFTGKFAG